MDIIASIVLLYIIGLCSIQYYVNFFEATEEEYNNFINKLKLPLSIYKNSDVTLSSLIFPIRYVSVMRAGTLFISLGHFFISIAGYRSNITIFTFIYIVLYCLLLPASWMLGRNMRLGE
jgi:hypothetical protein